MNRGHARSANLRISVTPVAVPQRRFWSFRVQLSRCCFADLPQRAPACAGAAHTRASLRDAARGDARSRRRVVHRRHAGCRSGVVAPHSPRQPTVPAGRPDDDLVLREWEAYAKDSHAGLFSTPKSAVSLDHYPNLAVTPTREASVWRVEIGKLLCLALHT
jgi:hypothetical protein